MKKTIWIFWLQGFETAPYVVTKCLDSWKVHNGDSWKIIELAEGNLEQYVRFERLTQQYADKKITIIALSEIVRLELLRTHGGLWVDATTYCTKPLDSWLPEHVEDGFFAFEQHIDRMLSTWFLYAEESNYIVARWHEAVLAFAGSRSVIGAADPHVSIDEWDQRREHSHYFWLHYLFGNLYKQDEEFRRSWDKIKKIGADGPHTFEALGMSVQATDDLKQMVRRNRHPLFKLNRRAETYGSAIAFLFQH